LRRFFYIAVTLFAFTILFNPVSVFATSVNKRIIVIDAGHGGWDPGKVGRGEKLEKDINLAIAEDLQVLLEMGGATVFLTRGDDSALGDTKKADLTARSTMPADFKADIFLSIHQNAYQNENAKGAQAFYYGDSAESKRLAEAIQTNIRSYLDAGNKKEAKADTGYFVLKKTQVPAVIVECGFLTNDEDLQKLTQENYQEKMAWAMYLGILDFFAGASSDAAILLI